MELTLQFWIVVVYFAAVTLVGLAAKRLVRSSKDILVAGRNLGVVLATVSVAGEWLGGTSTVAVGQWGFKYGFSPFWYNVSTAVGMFIFGLTWAKLYHRMGVYTVPELIERLYGRGTRLLSAAFFAVAYLLLSAVQVAAIGALFGTTLGLDINVAIIAAGVAITVYTMAGGMHSVALTNFIHVFMIFIGLFAAYAAYMSLAGGYAGIYDSLSSLHAEGVVPKAPDYYYSPFSMSYATVGAWLLGGIVGVFAAQASLQPLFAAKDWRTARRASLLTPLIVAPVGILVTSIVLAAMAVHGSTYVSKVAAETRIAFPEALMLLDNPVVGGLALAAVFAAIASTEAPILLGIATMISKDLYHSWLRPGASDESVLRMTRAAIFAAGAVSIALALVIKELPVAVYVNYAMRASVFILLALGIYLAKKPSPRVANAAIVASLATASTWYGVKLLTGAKKYPFGIHVVYVTIAAAFIVMLIGYLYERRKSA